MTDGRDELDDSLPALDVGDHVQDREDLDATMLVVGTPPARAKTYQIDDDYTVADVNPQYPAADHVVECVFPERTTADIKSLVTYAYPRERLERVATVHSDEDNTDDEALNVVCTQCGTAYQLTLETNNDCPDCGFVDWEVA